MEGFSEFLAVTGGKKGVLRECLGDGKGVVRECYPSVTLKKKYEKHVKIGYLIIFLGSKCKKQANK